MNISANNAFFLFKIVHSSYHMFMNRIALKTLRKNKGLTQVEAAKYLRVSLRSYKDYENKEKKIDTIKYRYFIDELSKIGFVDEEHGILSLEQIKEAVATVLKDYDVAYCYQFGSYSSGEANEKSDVDIMVKTSVTGLAFFGLAERLRIALGKKVDLLNTEQLEDNLHLTEEILKDGIKIYVKGR